MKKLTHKQLLQLNDFVAFNTRSLIRTKKVTPLCEWLNLFDPEVETMITERLYPILKKLEKTKTIPIENIAAYTGAYYLYLTLRTTQELSEEEDDEHLDNLDHFWYSMTDKEVDFHNKNIENIFNFPTTYYFDPLKQEAV